MSAPATGEPKRLFRTAWNRPVVPSRIDWWRGVREEGMKFTFRQLHIMKLDGIDPETVECVEVFDRARRSEWWWPDGTPTPLFVLECPIRKRRPSGLLLVISSSGYDKLVCADGTIGMGRGR